MIVVTGTENGKFDDEYIIKGNKQIEVETTHRKFKIGIDKAALSITFVKGSPSQDATEKHRLVLEDPQGGKAEKLKKVKIPLKKDDVEPDFEINGRIEVRSRW